MFDIIMLFDLTEISYERFKQNKTKSIAVQMFVVHFRRQKKTFRYLAFFGMKLKCIE